MLRLYPLEEWTITEDLFQPEYNHRHETIFTVSNGYIGMRGCFEEGWDGDHLGASIPGTYVNGFYETAPIQYGEEAYGYAKYRQTMLNVTSSKSIQLYIEGERFNLFTGIILKYKRQLDMKNGVMIREVRWESPLGKQVDIRITRFVSFTHKHLATINYEVTPLNFEGSIEIRSAINGEVKNTVSGEDVRTGSAFKEQVLRTVSFCDKGTFGAIYQKTMSSNFMLICSMDHHLDVPYRLETNVCEQKLEKNFHVVLNQGQTIHFEKYITYHTDQNIETVDLLNHALSVQSHAKHLGFAGLYTEQKECLYRFWQSADIQINGDLSLQQGLRFNAFQLFQSAGRDGYTHIGAKGLTGEGYEGHYFWDTEIYMVPFFVYTEPDIAKALLMYRYHTLPQAKARAQELSFKGALYSWRTIDGVETSAYYPAGTAQIHIVSDIAYALQKYMHATQDQSFFLEYGLEILIETARFIASFGNWIENKGFCINGVTGPDEYTALVNNNAYTNYMAQNHIAYLVEQLEGLPDKVKQQVWERFLVTEQELQGWKTIVEFMYIPKRIPYIAQDDSFFDKAVWDFENTPEKNYPLLLHYHPMVIYRYQVLKQADLILAFVLLSSSFTLYEKIRNYHYYEPITTHDSSLSPCIHAIMAAEIGELSQAYKYFMRTARMDLDDYQHNVKDGLHCASMAGSWLTIVQGFGGMSYDKNGLNFRPRIPEEWSSYQFQTVYQGRTIQLYVTKEYTTYRLLEGEPLEIWHYLKSADVRQDFPVCMPNRALEAVIFDLDGVLTDTQEFHFYSWHTICAKMGVKFTREMHARLIGVDRATALHVILNEFQIHKTYEEKNQLAKEKNEIYQTYIKKMGPQHVLPGIKSLLQQLRSKEIKIGLASHSQNSKLILKQLQIENYFDYIADASEVTCPKPDPEIYIQVAEHLNVHPSCCLGIDDSISGIEAIKRAGMVSIGIGAHPQAHLQFSKTNELSMEVLQTFFSPIKSLAL